MNLILKKSLREKHTKRFKSNIKTNQEAAQVTFG